MRILRLTLSNFKGVKSFCLAAQGENMTIKGNNATGKSTLFDAFLWLLFDKDSQNKSKFDIKTLDKNGNVLHGLDHEVEAELEIDVKGFNWEKETGTEKTKRLTLKKTFKEKWTQKKGTTNKIFSGHTTDYFINEVPVQAKEYAARIADIADEEVFRLLTNPRHFNEQVKWQDRRKVLLEVCGDITDADVIASDKALAKLPDLLGDHKLDEYKEMLKAKKKKINDELSSLPIRIDEVYRGLPDVEGLDVGRATEKIELLKGSIRKREQAISRIESGGEVAEKTKLLREIEAEMQEIKNSYTKDLQEKISLKKSELYAVDSGAEREINNLRADIERNAKKILMWEEDMVGLREAYASKKAEEFTFDQSDTCPTCSQPLPAEQLAEARQKAEESFNQAKAENLAEINSEGGTYKLEVETFQEVNKTIEARVKVLNGQIDIDTKNAESLKAEIIALEEKALLAPPAYTKKKKQKAEIEEIIAGLQDGSSDEKAKLYEEIAQLESSVKEAERVIADLSTYKQGQERIEELKRQEEKLSAEYAKLEESLFLTEEFTRAKVKMLEEKINSKFEIVTFKLFETQINGGLAEVCESLVDGVPYSTGLNYGHQIVGGLDVIRTLSRNYNFYPPIFVDNSEAISVLPEMEAQVIRLVKPEIASEADRKKYSKLVVAIQEKTMVEEAV